MNYPVIRTRTVVFCPLYKDMMDFSDCTKCIHFKGITKNNVGKPRNVKCNCDEIESVPLDNIMNWAEKQLEQVGWLLASSKDEEWIRGYKMAINNLLENIDDKFL